MEKCILFFSLYKCLYIHRGKSVRSWCDWSSNRSFMGWVSKYRFSITRNPIIKNKIMSKFKMDSKMAAIILLNHISITMCDQNTNMMSGYRFSITKSPIKHYLFKNVKIQVDSKKANIILLNHDPGLD